MILGDGEWITPADLPGHSSTASDGDYRLEDNLTKAIELYEKTRIQRTLGKTDGDKIRAGRIVGTKPVDALSQDRKARNRRIARGCRRGCKSSSVQIVQKFSLL